MELPLSSSISPRHQVIEGQRYGLPRPFCVCLVDVTHMTAQVRMFAADTTVCQAPQRPLTRGLAVKSGNQFVADTR